MKVELSIVDIKRIILALQDRAGIKYGANLKSEAQSSEKLADRLWKLVMK